MTFSHTLSLLGTTVACSSAYTGSSALLATLYEVNRCLLTVEERVPWPVKAKNAGGSIYWIANRTIPGTLVAGRPG